MLLKRKKKQTKHLIALLHLFLHLLCVFLCVQGRPGEKGNKGETGNSGYDLLSTSKVFILL
jgi:hypothetical protein